MPDDSTPYGASAPYGAPTPYGPPAGEGDLPAQMQAAREKLQRDLTTSLQAFERGAGVCFVSFDFDVVHNEAGRTQSVVIRNIETRP